MRLARGVQRDLHARAPRRVAGTCVPMSPPSLIRILVALLAIGYGATAAASGCLGEPDVLCLRDGRFRVHARWSVPGSGTGVATAHELTGETGAFSFFRPGNLELVVKVLDGCTLNQRFWVFVAGLTNVGATLTVEDTVTGDAWSADHPPGPAFPPLYAADALATCEGLAGQPREATTAWGPEVLATDLLLDLDALEGGATVTLAAGGLRTAYLSVAGLEVLAVRHAGAPLPHRIEDGRLLIGLPSGAGTLDVTVEYRFTTRPFLDGWVASGSSYLWPSFCGNLFPCHPHPADGSRFSLTLTGAAAAGAVHPREIPFDAPPYMPGIAAGDYQHEPLGVTAAGTRVGVWYLPGGREDALRGGRWLRAGFEWMEQTLGPYPYGPEVGSVEVDWPPRSGGGAIEQHPYWHVERVSLRDPVLHLHEAAHGWFGNGVRLRCWEDFVLSEGTASYLAARAAEAAAGPGAADGVWRGYARYLAVTSGSRQGSVWPPTCNRIDILRSRLFSLDTYYRGAFFLRDVERAVGRPAFDRVLRIFFAGHAGGAATLEDLLDTLRAETGFDPAELVAEWLTGEG